METQLQEVFLIYLKVFIFSILSVATKIKAWDQKVPPGATKGGAVVELPALLAFDLYLQASNGLISMS